MYCVECARRRYICHLFFFFSSRRRHTRCLSDWSSDVCSSDLFYRSIEAYRQSLRTRADVMVLDPSSDFFKYLKNRSEERRVGKECRSRWSRYPYKKREREELHREK